MAAEGLKIARIAIHLSPRNRLLLSNPNGFPSSVEFYSTQSNYYCWVSYGVVMFLSILKSCLIITTVVFETDPCSCSLQAGVLWHLLLFLFNYDFTLDESGVEKSAETNQQVRRQEKLNSCWKACTHCATEKVNSTEYAKDVVYETTSWLSFS